MPTCWCAVYTWDISKQICHENSVQFVSWEDNNFIMYNILSTKGGTKTL